MARETAPFEFVHGGRPTHVHTCKVGDEVHQWECDSPYCNYMQQRCPEHGGVEPIAEGREPWRR